MGTAVTIHDIEMSIDNLLNQSVSNGIHPSILRLILESKVALLRKFEVDNVIQEMQEEVKEQD